MKRSVTFRMEGWEQPITGYEGGDLPIDKAAETVLSSTAAAVSTIVFHFENGAQNTFHVLHSNDEAIGARCKVAAIPGEGRYYRETRCMISGMTVEHDGRCLLHRNNILAEVPPQTGDMLRA